MDDKIIFSSNWTTDQLLIPSEEITLTIPVDAEWINRQEIIDFSDKKLENPPMHMITVREDGEEKWHMQGSGATMSGTSLSPMFPSATKDKMFVYGGTPGTSYNIRYYIFTKSAVAE